MGARRALSELSRPRGRAQSPRAASSRGGPEERPARVAPSTCTYLKDKKKKKRGKKKKKKKICRFSNFSSRTPSTYSAAVAFRSTVRC